jgi:hypothetical protein
VGVLTRPTSWVEAGPGAEAGYVRQRMLYCHMPAIRSTRATIVPTAQKAQRRATENDHAGPPCFAGGSAARARTSARMRRRASGRGGGTCRRARSASTTCREARRSSAAAGG